MEHRIGYKKTQVGVFPESWNEEKLCDIVDRNRGIRYGIVQPGEYFYNGRYMVRGQDYSFGWVDGSEMFRVSPDIEIRYKNARLVEGDLIITIVGAGTGKVALVPEWLNGANITQTTARIAIDKEKGDSLFIKHLLESKTGQAQVNNFIKGGAQPGLNICDIKKFIIPMPSKSEQTAIATALSDTDALIENLEKLIAKKRNVKQGVMQELLTGRKRLAGFNGMWKLHQIGKIADVGRGRVISHREISQAIEGLYPVYSSQTTNDGIMGFIDTHDFEGEYITWTTDGVNAGRVFHRVGKFNCTNVCGTIKLKNDYPPFVAMVLDKVTPMHVSRNLANPKLMNDPMKRIEILIPEFEEQKAIANIISELGNEINSLKNKLNKYRMMKLGMMQVLLTGKIRLV